MHVRPRPQLPRSRCPRRRQPLPPPAVTARPPADACPWASSVDARSDGVSDGRSGFRRRPAGRLEPPPATGPARPPTVPRPRGRRHRGAPRPSHLRPGSSSRPGRRPPPRPAGPGAEQRLTVQVHATAGGPRLRPPLRLGRGRRLLPRRGAQRPGAPRAAGPVPGADPAAHRRQARRPPAAPPRPARASSAAALGPRAAGPRGRRPTTPDGRRPVSCADSGTTTPAAAAATSPAAFPSHAPDARDHHADRGADPHHDSAPGAPRTPMLIARCRLARAVPAAGSSTSRASSPSSALASVRCQMSSGPAQLAARRASFRRLAEPAGPSPRVQARTRCAVAASTWGEAERPDRPTRRASGPCASGGWTLRRRRCRPAVRVPQRTSPPPTPGSRPGVQQPPPASPGGRTRRRRASVAPSLPSSLRPQPGWAAGPRAASARARPCRPGRRTCRLSRRSSSGG